MQQGETSSLEVGITLVAPRRWLDPFDETSEARRVAELEARLSGDVELVSRLMFAGYDGPEWIEVADRLARYGLRVIEAWILDGTIVVRCRQKNLAAPWSHRCASRQEAEVLAADTVSTALLRFRDGVLIPGKWRADRGASLSTYFVGQCLLRWANVFYAWQRESRRTLPQESPLERAWEVDDHLQVLDRRQAVDLRDDPLVARVLVLRQAGYSWDELSRPDRLVRSHPARPAAPIPTNTPVEHSEGTWSNIATNQWPPLLSGRPSAPIMSVYWRRGHRPLGSTRSFASCKKSRAILASRRYIEERPFQLSTKELEIWPIAELVRAKVHTLARSRERAIKMAVGARSAAIPGRRAATPVRPSESRWC